MRVVLNLTLLGYEVSHLGIDHRSGRLLEAGQHRARSGSPQCRLPPPPRQPHPSHWLDGHSYSAFSTPNPGMMLFRQLMSDGTKKDVGSGPTSKPGTKNLGKVLNLLQ